MELQNENGDIVLRQLILSDAENLFDLTDRNRAHLAPWFWWVEKTNNVEDSKRFLEEKTKKFDDKTEITCGIWYKNKLIGLISLTGIDFNTHTAEVGYWLDFEYQGKGIMTNSCKLLINYAFKTLNLHRLEIRHIEQNEKSKAVIQRLGFVHEAHLREASFVNGKYFDDDFYSLLEQEWSELN